MSKPSILIGIVEDHTVLRKGLIRFINEFENCKVVLEAGNGVELQEELKKKVLPEIILLDIKMPVMNGYETLDWLQKYFPQIQIIVLTVYEAEQTAIRLFKAGAKAFLSKTTSLQEIMNAINSVKETGFYYNNTISRKILNVLYHDELSRPEFQHQNLSPKEIQFLQLAATDKTYERIADEMHISIRGVDKIRDHLFLKFDVKNRTALAVRSVKDGVIV